MKNNLTTHLSLDHNIVNCLSINPSPYLYGLVLLTTILFLFLLCLLNLLFLRDSRERKVNTERKSPAWAHEKYTKEKLEEKCVREET